MRYRQILVALIFLMFVACNGETENKGGSDAGGEESQEDSKTLVVFDKIDPEKVGTIEGMVRIEGEVPQLPPLARDGSGCHFGEIPNESLQIKDRKIRYVLVYLKGFRSNFPDETGVVELDQNGCVYAPHVLAMRLGQKLRVLNSDHTEHNVNCPYYNRSHMKGAAPIETAPEKSGIGIHFKCDIHPWMMAKLHVMKHPYYALTAEDGSFRIENVMPGEYTIQAWHERANNEKRFANKIKAKQEKQKVTVKTGETSKVEFVFTKK